MKKYSSLILLFALITKGAFADPIKLVERKEGKVKYYVSDANRLIHVILPFNLNVSLIENQDSPSVNKYYLSLFGEWSGDHSNESVKKIHDRYPKYLFTGESSSVSVLDCELRLSNGRKLDCSTPPASGKYFSSYAILTQQEGDSLKKELKNNSFSGLSVKVQTKLPYISSSTTIEVPVSRFRQSLGVNEKSISLGFLINKTTEFMSNQKIGNDSKVYDLVMDSLFEHCLAGEVNINPGKYTFKELLGVQISVRDPAFNSIPVTKEILGWNTDINQPEFDLKTNIPEENK